MVPLSLGLCLLTSFPWPLSIVGLTLHIIKVIDLHRIGAASFAVDAGMSDAQIRDLGRWKSNAFQKYIRIPSLSS